MRYLLHKEERIVNFYLTQHPIYEEIYFIYSFNGISDIYRTLFGAVESLSDVYYLWLPPSYFDKLKELILENEGSYMTYFRGQSMATGKGEYKRPMFARKIIYEAEDAKMASEELRFEYGILPQTIEFVIPEVSKFRINKKGYYTLISGNVGVFLDEVINNLIKMVIEDNREIETAKLEVSKINGKEALNLKEIMFELENEIDFEEMKGFIKTMEEEGFSLYNTNLKKGSVIFSTHIVDEKKGNIFSLTSDGKRFTLMPKYKSNFISLIRFHNFLIEKIDHFTKVIYSKKDAIK